MNNNLSTKELVYYYTDGGYFASENFSVSVFYKRQYKKKDKRQSLKSYKINSSTSAEVKAIHMALNDAENQGLNGNQVVIRTDQSFIVNAYKKKEMTTNDMINRLLKRLYSIKPTMEYVPSTHNYRKNLPKNKFYALKANDTVFSGAKRGLNRLQAHKQKKNNQQKK